MMRPHLWTRTTALRQSQSQWRVLSSATTRSPVALRSMLWIPTEKEIPADAAIPSHQLLVRGGFIRKSGHGVYTFLPLGKKVMRNLEREIDAEMMAIGGNKLDLPVMIPAELWKQSGRWQTRGPELITFADRRDEKYALAPTHEESITSLVANHYTNNAEAASLRLYQVGRKFRDEVRPRFGLLRAREFVMKDMYSFDTTFDRALVTYEDVVGAYRAILKDRLKLPIAQVEADSGNIGGNLSHEFHVVADVGEDALLSCGHETCGYAANVEKAQGKFPSLEQTQQVAEAALVALVQSARVLLAQGETAEAWKLLVQAAQHEQSDVTCALLREQATDDEKAEAVRRVALVLTREDRAVNELALKPFYNDEELEPIKTLPEEELQTLVQHKALRVFIDDSLQSLDSASPIVALAQEASSVAAEWGQFRLAEVGDGCPRCEHGHLEAKRGIEVGHVFYLGQKYSKPFNVTFTEHDPETKQTVKKVMEMGCFGLGVSRLIAAAVEVSHDAHGIVWPVALAPFKVLVMAIGCKKQDDPVAQAATSIARDLVSQQVGDLTHEDVLLDDRWAESPGSKLAESELLGYPYRVVVGRRFAKEGLVEVQTRATMAKHFMAPQDLHAFFQERRNEGEL